MKKLVIFFLKSFIGPFLATFFVSIFMLIMQFLWKYIDDLMGKGLEISVILELLFYVSASLLPLALPLAILLSSLIVLGNLGENLELTALKASGLSITRILRPLTGVIIFIAIGTFYFSNYVIPIANYKWHSIIWDIQEKKMTSFLKPGVYTQAIDGFSIKIKEGKDNSFKNIIIHDRRQSREIKTIVADSGEFFQSENGEFLFFKLYEGNVIEELADSPDFQQQKGGGGGSSIFPSRKSNFKTATYKMDMSGFQLQRTKDDLFKDDYEMLNVFQINKVADSINNIYLNLKSSLSHNSKSKHAYFQALNMSLEEGMDSIQRKAIDERRAKGLMHGNRKSDTLNEESQIPIDSNIVITPLYSFEEMDVEVREKTRHHMEAQLRSNIQAIEGQVSLIANRERVMRRFEIEFHRKFALSFSIIILFFIGAPLGAIIKRGGFGAPVVVAALIFMIYYVLITIGDEMARNDVISPFSGMWGPNALLTPVAVFLMIMATYDGNLSFITHLFKRKRKKDA